MEASFPWKCKEERMILMFYGDSLVNGTMDPACLGWPGRLCAAAWKRGLEITSYNLGVRAETSREVLGRFEAECPPRKLPGQDVGLVFSFGTGDSAMPEGKRRVSLEDSAANTRALLEAAERHGKVLFVGPPPLADVSHTERNRQTSAEIGRVCAELAVPFLDPMRELMKSNAYMRDLESGDGIHPGAEGYEVLAGLVGAWEEWGKLIGI
jgi:lysophospholipase L1-like esterase